MKGELASYQRIIAAAFSLNGIFFDDRSLVDEANMQNHLNLELSTLWKRGWFHWILNDDPYTFTNNQLDLSAIPTIRDVMGVFIEPLVDAQLLARTKVPSEILGRLLTVYDHDTFTDDLHVRSRPPIPEFTGTDWDNTVAYKIAEQVLHKTDGHNMNKTEVWVALTAHTGTEPGSEGATPTDWQQLEVPVEFEEYLIHSAANNWLRTEGQTSKQLADKINPEDALMDLFDLHARQLADNDFAVKSIQPANL